MKLYYRFLAGLVTCAISFAIFTTPLQVSATTPEKEEIERERIAQYEKEIESNSIPNWPQGPQVYADSAIVMEASTGAILYSKDMDKAEYPASITKYMTALLALENCSLDEMMTYSYYATHSIGRDSSTIGTTEGEELTVEESLYALLLESANECGNGLAEHIAESVEAFADMMNQRASELGCTNTHFNNPHGLPDENHYTTAHDMALITQAALKLEAFVTISGSARYDMRPTNKDEEITYMRNHHKMINSYQGDSRFLDDTVIAGKTGYTNSALNTLITVAERNGMTLIVVTMRTHSTDDKGIPFYTDTALLLDYATDNFTKINIAANETHFSIGNSEFFHTASNIFGKSQSLIEVNPDGYVILPNDAVFSDAAPSLEFQNETDDPNIIATLSYTYEGQPVGSTTIGLAEGTIRNFNLDNETADTSTEVEASVPGITAEDVDAEPPVPEKTFIKINVKLILTIVLIVAIAAFLVFIIYQIWQNFYFHMRLPAKRRRSRRKRFRSRRRRRSSSRSRRNSRR